jgi:hypothetical protein
MTHDNPFGETIYSYSRAQAIEDGVLVDLSHVDSIRQHWKYPFACTSAVWGIIEDALKKEGQDLPGICHDISTVAKLMLRTAPAGTDRVLFPVIIAERTRTLKLHVGPGDTPDPVITLMLTHES